MASPLLHIVHHLNDLGNPTPKVVRLLYLTVGDRVLGSPRVQESCCPPNAHSAPCESKRVPKNCFSGHWPKQFKHSAGSKGLHADGGLGIGGQRRDRCRQLPNRECITTIGITAAVKSVNQSRLGEVVVGPRLNAETSKILDCGRQRPVSCNTQNSSKDTGADPAPTGVVDGIEVS